ncbi:MAG TPA: sugar ABC transporter permease [Caldilineaceae bacterium]|nr:sugar ABC transporter permease [Caldilineaceae bacterium]
MAFGRPEAVAAPARRRLFHITNRKREALMGYLFLSPWLLGFLIFLAGPMLASLYLSMTQYQVVRAPQWIGLANYQRMLGDELFYHSLTVTAKYTAASVPLGIVVALGLAVLLNQRIVAPGLFRAIFYLPSIISGVAVAIVFAWIFNFRFGVLNYLLSWLAIPGPNWLGSPRWVLWAFVLMSIWGVGGNVVIFLAALQGVPRSLYEAAEIDGAGGWTRFWYITLPLISPAILFVAIIGVIYSFQTFTQSYIMTGGGPANATLFYLLYLYKNAFTWFEMGYASALAWVLFLVILACTLMLLYSSNRWVYYEGDAQRGRQA